MPRSELVIYVDHSEVREGRLEDLKTAIKDLAEFVKAKEPRIIAYNVYFTEDGKRMTVIHVHPDSDSLKFHMNVAGPAFAKFADYVRMLTINVYGEINESLLEQLKKKAQMLGNASVIVHEYHAGFTHWGER